MSRPGKSAAWRQQLRRSIGWTLLIKFFALIALWALFFSPAQRVDVGPERVESRLALDAGTERPDD